MISAIVLAAGQSKRMGQQKMLLPWGKTTVIGKVVSTLLEGGVHDIHVVTGGSHSELEKSSTEIQTKFHYSTKIFEMAKCSPLIQVGLSSLWKSEAALIVLGDQPQIETWIVQAIVDRYLSTHHKIIVPSYNMHRGHPWLVEKSYWKEISRSHASPYVTEFFNFAQSSY